MSRAGCAGGPSPAPARPGTGRAPGDGPRGRGGTARHGGTGAGVITVTCRLLAWAVLSGALLALAALGSFTAVSDRVTGREILAALVMLVFAAAAVAWLNRTAGSGGGDPGEDPACPYATCHHNHPGEGGLR
jgi:hypothetical protein